MDELIRYKLGDDSLGVPSVDIYNNSYVFKYPCQNSISERTFYEVLLKPGAYIFETWGT